MSSIVSSSSLGAHAAVPRCSCCLLLALPWRRPEVSRLPSSAHRASSITPPSIPASTWMPASPSNSSSRCCSPGRPHLEPPPPTSCANLHPRLAGLRMPMSAGPAPTSARACAGQRPPLRRWCCPMSANAHCCWPQRRHRPAVALASAAAGPYAGLRLALGRASFDAGLRSAAALALILACRSCVCSFSFSREMAT